MSINRSEATLLWEDAIHCGTSAESRKREDIRNEVLELIVAMMNKYRDNARELLESDFYTLSALLSTLHITCGNEADIVRACGVVLSFKYAKSKDVYPEEVQRLHVSRTPEVVDFVRERLVRFQEFPSSVRKYLDVAYAQRATVNSVSAQEGLKFIIQCIAKPMTVLEVRLRTEDSELFQCYLERAMAFNEAKVGERNAGFDLLCPADQETTEKLVELQHHVTVVAVRGGVAQPWLLMPRSSMSKTSFRLANSVGLMDAGYRGDAIAMLDAVRECEGSMRRGDRFVQAVGLYGPIERVRVLRRDESFTVTEVTDRGEGGFGSTG